MGIAMDISRSHGGTLAGAKEMGAGLMRGNRGELKLGYTAANAYLAVRAAFERDGLTLTTGDLCKVAAYLVGFSGGMRDERLSVPAARAEVRKLVGVMNDTPIADTYQAGFYAGQDTDITKVYPGDGDSPDAPAVA